LRCGFRAQIHGNDTVFQTTMRLVQFTAPTCCNGVPCDVQVGAN
jgi:hypothetical protein